MGKKFIASVVVMSAMLTTGIASAREILRRDIAAFTKEQLTDAIVCYANADKATRTQKTFNACAVAHGFTPLSKGTSVDILPTKQEDLYLIKVYSGPLTGQSFFAVAVN